MSIINTSKALDSLKGEHFIRGRRAAFAGMSLSSAAGRPGTPEHDDFVRGAQSAIDERAGSPSTWLHRLPLRRPRPLPRCRVIRAREIALGLFCFAVGVMIGAPRSENERKSGMTFDTGYSDCRFTPSPDGQWYQKDQDHSSRYKAGCGTFGLSFDLNPAWTVGIHYVQLGRANVEALAVAFPGDARENMTAGINTTRAACGGQFTAACLYQWHTGTFTRGVNFSFAHKLFEIGGVRFDGKVGMYAHQLTSHAQVEPLGCRDNCPWRIQIDQSAQRITPMWGVVARWKYFFASWESYESIGCHTPVTANVKGSVEVKTIGVRIPI